MQVSLTLLPLGVLLGVLSFLAKLVEGADAVHTPVCHAVTMSRVTLVS